MLGAIVSLFMGDSALARYDAENPQYGCTLIDERLPGGQNAAEP
jgi:hypothetical protein